MAAYAPSNSSVPTPRSDQQTETQDFTVGDSKPLDQDDAKSDAEKPVIKDIETTFEDDRCDDFDEETDKTF